MTLDTLKRACSGCLGTGKSGHIDGENRKHEYECSYCGGRGYHFIESQITRYITDIETALVGVLGFLEDPLIGNWTYMEGEGFYKDKNTHTAKIRFALGIASDAHFCDKCLSEGKRVLSSGLATFPNSVKCHLCESCARETVGAL